MSVYLSAPRNGLPAGALFSSSASEEAYLLSTGQATGLGAYEALLNTLSALGVLPAIPFLQSQLARSARSRRNNCRTKGVMATPPAVTTSASAPSAPYALTTAASYASMCAVEGGWPLLAGGVNLYANVATQLAGQTTGQVIGNNAHPTTYRIAYHTDAVIHTLRILPVVLTTFRVLVDGQYTTSPIGGAGYNGITANTTCYVTVDFTSAGGHVPGGRLIELEFQYAPITSGGSFNPVYLSGWNVDPRDTIWPPSTDDVGPLFMAVTDSWGIKPYILASNDPYSQVGDNAFRVMGDTLGLPNTWCSGVAGTGWIARASSTVAANALDRITDVTGWAPKEILYCLGVNDVFNAGTIINGVTISTTTVATQVAAVLTQVRAALPGVPIHVGGVWPDLNSGSGGLTAITAMETAILAAANGLGDPLISTFSMVGWLTGTGAVGNLQGDGNRDYYQANDTVHLYSTDGNAYIGAKLSDAVDASRRVILSRFSRQLA